MNHNHNFYNAVNFLGRSAVGQYLTVVVKAQCSRSNLIDRQSFIGLVNKALMLGISTL